MRAGRTDLTCRQCKGTGDLKWLIVHGHDGHRDSRILAWLFDRAVKNAAAWAKPEGGKK